uniref:Uncharacterized protein n=1 Tax=Rhizophora mucronata TaxID=61149 RepID=A0A2P2NSX1_RHIMU
MQALMSQHSWFEAETPNWENPTSDRPPPEQHFILRDQLRINNPKH